jgi:hypothetical protein
MYGGPLENRESKGPLLPSINTKWFHPVEVERHFKMFFMIHGIHILGVSKYFFFTKEHKLHLKMNPPCPIWDECTTWQWSWWCCCTHKIWGGKNCVRSSWVKYIMGLPNCQPQSNHEPRPKKRKDNFAFVGLQLQI